MSNNILSYTNRDINSIRSNIISKIPEISSDWTDFNESDIGMAYIEALSGVADMLGYYLDKQALENFLPTVKQLKNAKSIIKLVNQKANMINSSMCYVTFSLNEPWEEDIIIPKHTSLAANYGEEVIYYYTSEDCHLLRGDTQVKVKAKQGIVIKKHFLVEEITKSKLKILDKDIANKSVEVIVDGESWEEVDDIFFSKSVNKEFSVEEDKDDIAIITLNRGYKSLLPMDKEAIVEVIYAQSLGAKGSVRRNTITSIVTNLRDVKGNNLSDKLFVTNNEPSSGGSNRETVEELRYKIPEVVKTMDSAITLTDYKSLIENYPGVLKSSTLDWSIEGDYVKVPYTIHSYIVPTDGYSLSEAFIDDIIQYMKPKCMAGTRLKIFEPKYIKVELDIKVSISGNFDLATTIYHELLDKLRKMFNPKNLEFGKGVTLSSIYTLVQSHHDAILDVEVRNPTSNLKLNLVEFPKLESIHLEVEPTNSIRRY